MKRSEMVKKFLEWGFSHPAPKSEEEAVSIIIGKLEELGMLPPPIPGSPKGKIYNRCKWEKEDEPEPVEDEFPRSGAV